MMIGHVTLVKKILNSLNIIRCVIFFFRKHSSHTHTHTVTSTPRSRSGGECTQRLTVFLLPCSPEADSEIKERLKYNQNK